MCKKLKALWSDEKGQAMSEYGLIIALIAVAVIVALGVMSGALQNIFNRISNSLNTA